MAQYKAHTLINTFVALPPIIVVAIFALALPRNLIMIGVGSFLYGTLFMSPDVDLAYNLKPLSIRGFLGLPFRSYARIFAHRGISHSLLFGTLTRILWLALYALPILYLIYAIAYAGVPTKATFLAFYNTHRLVLIACFAGLFLADASHIIVDKLTS